MCRTTPLLSTRFGAVSTVPERIRGRKVTTPRHMMRRNLHRNCFTLPARHPKCLPVAFFRGAGTGPVMVSDARCCADCRETVQPAGWPLLQGPVRGGNRPARCSGRSSDTPPGLRLSLRPRACRGLPDDLAAPPVAGWPTAPWVVAPPARPGEGGRNHEWPPMHIRSSGPTAVLAVGILRKSQPRDEAELSPLEPAGIALAPPACQAGCRWRPRPKSWTSARRVRHTETITDGSSGHQRIRFGYGHVRTAGDAGRAIENVMQIALNVPPRDGNWCRFFSREICRLCHLSNR
jgi:hypothetical protein